MGFQLEFIFVFAILLRKGDAFWTAGQSDEQLSCPSGQILIEKPEGLVCMPDLSEKWRRQGSAYTTTISPFGFDFGKQHKFPGMKQQDSAQRKIEPSYSYSHNPTKQQGMTTTLFSSSTPSTLKIYYLPENKVQMRMWDIRCLEAKKVYWPYDQNCYSLLERGPCMSNNDWLVLKPAENGRVSVQCSKRPCPCNDKDPILCEAFVRSLSYQNGCEQDGCRVALAAEQDGLCDKGEQLFVTPFGEGICGCRRDPLHIPFGPEHQCYPLFSKGPCPENHTLQYSNQEKESVCVPSLCPPGLVLYHNDGRCYKLKTRGPCGEWSTFKPNETSKEADCMPNHHASERVFDAIPSELENMLSNGNAINRIKALPRDCKVSHNSNKCLQFSPDENRNREPHARIPLEKAAKFLDWMLSFKNAQKYTDPDF